MIDGILPRRKKDVSQPETNTDIQDQELLTTMDKATVIEPSFRPPELIASEDTPKPKPADSSPKVAAFDIDSTPPNTKPVITNDPPKQRLSLKLPFHMSRKVVVLVSMAAVLLVGGGGVAAYMATHKSKAPVAQTKPVETKAPEPPKPVVFTSKLTGKTVSEAESKLPVTGVMIENSPDARPQAGLKDAGIVYEAIAEGGITRFLALFQESQVDYIGPVRSARPYYVRWLQGYDAALAHVGGSPEALALIRAEGVKDLDQFSNSGAFNRISSRYAPHNVYTSRAKLSDLEKNKGYTSSNFTGFARKEEKPTDTPGATSIDFTLSGYLYNVHYDYNKESNSYKRNQAGRPHLDDKSGEQLQPKVVVGLAMSYDLQSDGLHSEYGTIGSGKAYIFQDGTVTIGKWSKAGPKDPLLIGDANGSPLPLNPGQTWITALAGEDKATYK